MKHRSIKSIFIALFAVILVTVVTVACKKDKYVQIDGVCPIILRTDPANLATNVSAGKVITITFNEKMDPATITQESFTLQGASRVPGTLSYDPTNATISFVPSTSLSANTSYSGRVKAGIKDLTGNALQTDYMWTFSTGSVILPFVIATDPTNTAVAVVLNKTITATFNMAMDPATMIAANFSVQQGTSAVSGTVSYNGTTIYFAPSTTLTPNTVYTATISAGAKNIFGTALAASYSWSFTTGTLNAPKVISTDPVNNATGVALNKIITASFSEAMDGLTINSSNFLLAQANVLIPGTVSYNGTMASFDPTAPLLPNTLYTATVSAGTKNLGGTPLANDYVWAFTTGSNAAPKVISTVPANNATAIPLNQIITANFSEAMDPLSISVTSFLLKKGNTVINGSVTYNGTTATFVPSTTLSPGSIYTATITTAAKNPSGVFMANDYVWSFSTISTTVTPPFVDLKTVGRFGIIAGVGVSNNAGFSEIHDLDVGIYPGVRSSITGFPPAIVVNGAIYASDDIAPPGVAAMLAQAKLDLTAAYLFAEGATAPAPATVSGDLGGQTLAPGIYKSTSTLLIQNGNLTLDGGGDPNAFWVFQIASAFTTVGGAGGSIILSGGAQAKNVFWQTGSSATIGDYTSFKGTVLALTSITMNSHATAVGRMLARNGAVVMTSTNFIYKP